MLHLISRVRHSQAKFYLLDNSGLSNEKTRSALINKSEIHLAALSQDFMINLRWEDSWEGKRT